MTLPFVKLQALGTMVGTAQRLHNTAAPVIKQQYHRPIRICIASAHASGPNGYYYSKVTYLLINAHANKLLLIASRSHLTSYMQREIELSQFSGMRAEGIEGVSVTQH